MPPNHELFLSKSETELTVDFFVDFYHRFPAEANRAANGEVVFANTGDDWIDALEKKLAAGESLTEDDYMTQEQRDQLESIKRKRETPHRLTALKKEKTFGD